ncbi:DUF423 domain-containing protein [Bradyrhizobium sp.]|uniref:DUF423 domain-containing protein n=1 Tax=Bradyrhizobium sp. TaxID=376 RepID=UPI001D5461F6|nr:DUF423 domain-containing protein [Bradyrhizobium sp.]MBV8697749.1 DUF423 domain-containing protein [Bradyrhizobium sp.]MBV8922998.1 DUF423 domain-containing protein [Bradyrhizobium sp.]MBV9982427.1 DUF423 domain-containing protein [Bradyrhizobium sp.]
MIHRIGRGLVMAAGLMGASGVALAALSAHGGDAARLAPASSMLLFHAAAVIGAVALAGRLVHAAIAMTAGTGFVVAAALFSGDLALRHFSGHGLFPFAPPIGGTLLIASWLALALAAIWPRRV